MRNFSNTLILIAKRYQYFDPSKHHYEKHKIMSRAAYKEIEYARTNNVSPRVWRDDMSAANGSSTIAYRFPSSQAICVSPRIQKSRRIYVRPRTGSQRAYSLGSCAMGQTDGRTDRQRDGSRYSKMPPRAGAS